MYIIFYNTINNNIFSVKLLEWLKHLLLTSYSTKAYSDDQL